MKLLLNSTKTMDTKAALPRGYRSTQPLHLSRAEQLVAGLRKLSGSQFCKEMSVSGKLADAAQADLARWGRANETTCPALFAFTGLVYKYLDAPSLSLDVIRSAQQDLILLSGLYGWLRPSDRIANYRLEMGARWAPGAAKNLVAYWQEELTSSLNRKLRKGEPVLNLAAQEYVKALDLKQFKGALISPVFKEKRPDGSLKTAPVHAKMARGAMARFFLIQDVQEPADLLAFGELGWEAECEPPASGSWLFTRPVRD